ncbi:MAG: alpha-glucosidase [Treponema sp.]|jgi:oligo-1,6-glucosidase|nr:alpha-glucosidase [Treponema sp.]
MKAWWKEGVVYQIYPRSFQDSNGDGVGDLPGIISRLDAVAELGADIIWLSPVYASPGIDNGYDISDYRSIDPLLGTMADMDRLFGEAKKRGIRIIMDLVVNHTSDEHEWFQKSRRREPGYEDYYIWLPGKNGRPVVPPNNWTSFFMEDAWTWDELRGEYYLHLFHKKQPDLNYKNPKVIDEVKGILKFWLDRGASGFRCDVINALYKTSLEDGKKNIMITGTEHFLCQEGNHEILRILRRDVLDHYDCFTVGETALVNLEDAKLLSDEKRRELNMVFYFDHLEVDRLVARFVPKKFRAGELLKRLDKWQRGLEWNAVYLENHDQSRIVSHYGAGEKNPLYWERSAKLLAVLEFTLRGTPFVYQGQEIGMTNFDFTGMGEVKDIESHNLDRLMKKLHLPARLRWKWIRASSRDNARTPYQWSAGAGAGFTTGEPWLGINGSHRRINYEAQKDDPASVLGFYKRILRLRAGSETLKYGEFHPLFARGPCIAYERRPPAPAGRPETSAGQADGAPPEDAAGSGGVYTVLLNFSGKTAELPRSWAAAPFATEPVLSNTGRTAPPSGTLEPWEAVILKGR